MDTWLKFIKTQYNRPRTKLLLAMGAILMVSALGIGISDNPPGIGLTYFGIVLLCFSMLHHWRSARDFGTLLAVAIISFPVLVLIHNIFDAINTQIGVVPVVNQLLSGISVMAFITGVLVAPAVALVGILGGLFYLIKKHPN
ncbi:MAG: hypothetical protein H8E26_13780 [FCB group bacterium]|nr:hypothetical protein [FCB group bacterium]MBL7027033.1 hypothetical protein [Candidatus Neomarinimicrobiota bacterium]MBL7122213.1 hypothetical protein [Candidatus Neomarinimicrobiota bacterium]